MERAPVTYRGLRKAAMLLVLLGEEASSLIFRHLNKDEISDLTQEITHINVIPSAEMGEILREFYNYCVARDYAIQGGIEYAKGLLMKSMDVDSAKNIIDRLKVSLETSAGFNSLSKVDPQQLAKFIQNEHPQSIALILAHLDPTNAAEALMSLPDNLRADVSIRMANLEEISPDVVKRVSNVLEKKLETFSTYNIEEYGGVRAVAEIFNRMDRRMCRAVLEQIEDCDTGLAASIRDLMFVFEDILHIDDQGIVEILKRVDRKVLSMALKGTSKEMQEQFFRNMSKRGAEMIKEEIEYLGPVKLREVEKAQHEIVEIVRTLEEDGLITTGGGGDQFVV